MEETTNHVSETQELKQSQALSPLKIHKVKGGADDVEEDVARIGIPGAVWSVTGTEKDGVAAKANTKDARVAQTHSKKVIKHALRQQAKRRRKNTTIAAGNIAPVQRLSLSPNCDLEDLSIETACYRQPTMAEVLASIPGFSVKPRKRSNKKLSAAAQIEQTKEGCVDLETPDSILVNTNLRSLLNKHTFSSLPPLYQYKLLQLLPHVDRVPVSDAMFRLSASGLNNEFFARACLDWKERLAEGEFTPENQAKLKAEQEKEKSKLDPWKLKHFEPLWGESLREWPSLPPNSLTSNVTTSTATSISSSTTSVTTTKSSNKVKVAKPPPPPPPLRTVGAVTRAVASLREKRLAEQAISPLPNKKNKNQDTKEISPKNVPNEEPVQNSVKEESLKEETSKVSPKPLEIVKNETDMEDLPVKEGAEAASDFTASSNNSETDPIAQAVSPNDNPPVLVTQTEIHSPESNKPEKEIVENEQSSMNQLNSEMTVDLSLEMETSQPTDNSPSPSAPTTTEEQYLTALSIEKDFHEMESKADEEESDIKESPKELDSLTIDTKIDGDSSCMMEKESPAEATEVSDEVSQEAPSVQCETTVSSDLDSIAKTNNESEPDLKISNDMEVMEESQSSEVSQKESLRAPSSELIDSVDATSEQESQMDLSPYIVDLPNESSSEGMDKNPEKCSMEVVSVKDESKMIELSMKNEAFSKPNIDEDWEIIKVDPNSENSTDVEHTMEKDMIVEENKKGNKEDCEEKNDSESYYQQMLYQQSLKEDEAALLAAAWDVVESSEFQDVTLQQPVSVIPCQEELEVRVQESSLPAPQWDFPSPHKEQQSQGHVKLELEVTLTPEVDNQVSSTVGQSCSGGGNRSVTVNEMRSATPVTVIPPTTIVCLPQAPPTVSASPAPPLAAPPPLHTSSSSSALPYLALTTSTPVRAVPTKTVTKGASGGRHTNRNSHKPPPGAVNLERSYQICQAVIQNSPNRHQLRCQLKPPPSLLAKAARAATTSRTRPPLPPQGRPQSQQQHVLLKHVFTSSHGIPVNMAVLPPQHNNSQVSSEYVMLREVRRSNSAPPSNVDVLQQSAGGAGGSGGGAGAASGLIGRGRPASVGGPRPPDYIGGLASQDNTCACSLKAMIVCAKCGAFCHNDCVTASRLCITCCDIR
ncbi:hypothetical protein O3M35_005319 [Rhynocoris fuscipes]|uniref:DEUBAD domain-containing protein n=1 Tax=Rhynocoris fuscipes TaxID=488301 RepID=A0AAW1DQE9_9HEMI